MENLKSQLENGTLISFDNELWCIENQSDDFKQIDCSHRNETKNTWANGFKIEFNGQIIYSSKTFKSFEKKLKSLIEEHNLVLSNVVETEEFDSLLMSSMKLTKNHSAESLLKAYHERLDLDSFNERKEAKANANKIIDIIKDAKYIKLFTRLGYIQFFKINKSVEPTVEKRLSVKLTFTERVILHSTKPDIDYSDKGHVDSEERFSTSYVNQTNDTTIRQEYIKPEEIDSLSIISSDEFELAKYTHKHVWDILEEARNNHSIESINLQKK